MITDLTSRQASPQRLAAIVRSQWTIENRHWPLVNHATISGAAVGEDVG
ncbi:hypothetical protein [Streptomyces lunaelactis]|nr:hypothetical protein [Streptomyces lunaelactis]NUK25443.1 hypothetical protein [Streptomyces lunaelactis]